MQNVFPVYSIGHFINEPTSRADFALTLFETMDEPNVDDPHRHTFYEIIWVDAGQSKQAIDYTNYQLCPRSLFFISPGQLHFFEEWEHLKGGSILFTEDFFLLNHQNKDKLFELSFLDNFYANPLLKLTLQDYQEIRHIIELMEKEQQRVDSAAGIIQALLHVLVSQIQRCIDQQNSQRISRKYVILYKKLKRLLDEQFMEHRSVSDYASQLAITQHHLNLVCREVTGKTAGEVIRARSLLEAKRLLTFTDNSVSEVAAQLGFLDSSYFARVFRQDVGMSPVAFKQSMSEMYRL